MVAKQSLKRIIFIVLILVSLILMPRPQSKAFDMLLGPRDVISTNAAQTMAYHEIRFGLSETSEAVNTTDYIFFDLTRFTGLTEPTAISGNYTGTPVYAVIGTRIRITGIHINPGSTVTFSGITAYNPSDRDQFDVYISVATDPDGLNIRAFAHILATPTDGSVVVSAMIRAMVGTLRISGMAPPGMFVNFAEGGNVIGTAITASSGTFSQVFPNMSPVTHTILVFGTDAQSRNTPPTVVEIFPRPYEVTSVSGIILPPTISVDKEQIARGESITISGSGVPGYTTRIFTEPPLSSYEVTVGQDGNFSYTLADTSSLDYGDHKVYALIQDGLGTQSLFSTTVFFKVVDSTTPPDHGSDPSCDITKGDLNCDNRVNLVDFSILLYYWGGANKLADINADGNVNLVDFSIMMFYWNG